MAVIANEKSFFTQFYGEGAWGHQKIAVDDNHCGSCLGDYEPTDEYLPSAQDVRFGSIATVSLINNGHVPDSFLCDFFFDFLDFHVGWKKN